MKTLTKRFYNIVAYFSASRREGDNEAPSPLSKGGHAPVQYVIFGTSTFPQFLDSPWYGEVIW
jgi:hypothetical protein